VVVDSSGADRSAPKADIAFVGGDGDGVVFRSRLERVDRPLLQVVRLMPSLLLLLMLLLPATPARRRAELMMLLLQPLLPSSLILLPTRGEERPGRGGYRMLDSRGSYPA
jgi:hypothetical protein